MTVVHLRHPRPSQTDRRGRFLRVVLGRDDRDAVHHGDSDAASERRLASRPVVVRPRARRAPPVGAYRRGRCCVAPSGTAADRCPQGTRSDAASRDSEECAAALARVPDLASGESATDARRLDARLRPAMRERDDPTSQRKVRLRRRTRELEWSIHRALDATPCSRRNRTTKNAALAGRRSRAMFERSARSALCRSPRTTDRRAARVIDGDGIRERSRM